MTGIWKGYDRNMKVIWQEYERDMTGIQKRYDTNMKEIWHEYERDKTGIQKRFNRKWRHEFLLYLFQIFVIFGIFLYFLISVFIMKMFNYTSRTAVIKTKSCTAAGRINPKIFDLYSKNMINLASCLNLSVPRIRDKWIAWTQRILFSSSKINIFFSLFLKVG